MNTISLLQQAQLATKQGNRRKALELLREVVRQEPQNDTAWELLADVADTKEHAADCLKQALKINPDNESAKRTLSALTTQITTPLSQAPPTPKPPPLQASEMHSDTKAQSISTPLLEKTATSSRPASNNRGWFMLMNILLILLLAINAVQFVFTYQQNQIAATRAASYQERVTAAQELVAAQRGVIFDLVNNYKNSAYSNPNVERIAEQQLIASEYTLSALQIIAIQNSQIIELLANAP